MSTNSKKELIEWERLIGIRIMQEDAESIYSLLQTERNPIFTMEIIPYYALFVQSCQEYTGEDLLPKSIAKDLKDIRNRIFDSSSREKQLHKYSQSRVAAAFFILFFCQIL